MNRHTHHYRTATSIWIERLQQQGLSPNSLLLYECALKNLRQFLFPRHIRHTDAVTSADLTAWQKHLKAMGCAPATIASFTLTVKRWFTWQVATGLLFANPARSLQTPTLPPPKTRCPSEEIMRQLLASTKGRSPTAVRNRAILETTYATGARLGEIAGLELSSLDLKRGSVRLYGKGRKERVVPLTHAAVRALCVYLRKARPKLLYGGSGQTALFIGTRGGARMKRAAFIAVARKYSQKIRCKVTFHDIRRAFVTHLSARGAPLAMLRELLGHATFSHLHHYLKDTSAEALSSIREIRQFQ